MSRLYRIAVAGAGTLSARELGIALSSRRFPALDPFLWEGAATQAETADEAEGGTRELRLSTFGDEAALLRPFIEADLEGLDLVFIAGAMPGEPLGPILRQRGIDYVDLSGQSEDDEAALVGLDPARELEAWQGSLDAAVVAHPAAQILAHLSARLPRAGAVASMAAVIYEPVSERGWPGIRELEGQTTKLLNLKPLPTDVFGTQVAFNLELALGEEAVPALSVVRERIRAQTRRLLEAAGGGRAPALELVQAPVFHGTGISLMVRYDGSPGIAAIEAVLDSPFLRRGAAPPDLLTAAGEEAIQLAPPRPEPEQPGTWWLFATLDNLRRTALSATDAAAALLRLRETRA